MIYRRIIHDSKLHASEYIVRRRSLQVYSDACERRVMNYRRRMFVTFILTHDLVKYMSLKFSLKKDYFHVVSRKLNGRHGNGR